MAAWNSQGNVGSDNSNAATFPAFNTDLDDVKPEEPFNHDVAQPPHQNLYGGLPQHSAPDYRHDATSAASPQWSTSSSDAVEKIPRSGHVQSPTFNHNAPHLRRDGVRKKNARFDIPDGHNVHTIDLLIAAADPTNEDKIRTLKQEKRLLRNRQAALDSRCRKKHHTEKLEEEKKQFITMIDRLEEEMQNLRIQEQRWLHERQQWHQFTEGLAREKEELVRQHTLETAELRKKNNCLMEEIRRLESVSMSAQPSSAGISAGFPEFEHLTMDTSSFDDFAFIENPVMNTEHKNEASLVVLPKKETPPPMKSEDTSAASPLLLMLLLCGAWVASNTSSASAVIPRMPDDIQVASSAILKNIYKDAGIEACHTPRPVSSSLGMARAGTFSSHPNPSPLAALHNDLTTPTQQQEREQLFSLSTDQYNHMMADDLFADEPELSAPSGRRNLGELFTAVRAEKKGPAAEVYTRSLMRSEVPANVVRDFARMVAEGSARNTEPLS